MSRMSGVNRDVKNVKSQERCQGVKDNKSQEEYQGCQDLGGMPGI